MAQLTSKLRGRGLEITTDIGSSGTTYLIFRSLNGSYHVFSEVEAKEAARDCGATEGHNTRSECKEVWNEVLRSEISN